MSIAVTIIRRMRRRSDRQEGRFPLMLVRTADAFSPKGDYSRRRYQAMRANSMVGRQLMPRLPRCRILTKMAAYYLIEHIYRRRRRNIHGQKYTANTSERRHTRQP